MSDRRRQDYVGRHRREDPPTIPMRVTAPIIRFLNERYHTKTPELFTHPLAHYTQRGTIDMPATLHRSNDFRLEPDYDAVLSELGDPRLGDHPEFHFGQLWWPDDKSTKRKAARRDRNGRFTKN